jgi:hypothetical protein
MDEVERQLNLAESFLAEAELKAGQATCISNLPEYMRQRLGRLIFTIPRRREMKDAITSVRNSIPEEAIEAERQRLKAGRQQRLEL